MQTWKNQVPANIIIYTAVNHNIFILTNIGLMEMETDKMDWNSPIAAHKYDFFIRLS